jgi:hypothetical protein
LGEGLTLLELVALKLRLECSNPLELKACNHRLNRSIVRLESIFGQLPEAGDNSALIIAHGTGDPLVFLADAQLREQGWVTFAHDGLELEPAKAAALIGQLQLQPQGAVICPATEKELTTISAFIKALLGILPEVKIAVYWPTEEIPPLQAEEGQGYKLCVNLADLVSLLTA